MKIAIDCRLIGSSGIGTFIENVVSNIVEKREHEFILIGQPENLEAYRAKGNCTIIPCSYKSFTLKELLCFPSKAINQCDAFYTPNFNIPGGIHIPIYSTIHDIVLLDTDHFHNKIKKIITQEYLKRALHISTTVFTVSNFSKGRIEDTFKNNTQITVIPNGISNTFQTLASKTKLPEVRQGIVYLGNLKKHKGIHTLLEAYDLLLKDGFDKPLTLIGKFDFRTKDDAAIAKIHKFGNKVRFVNNADNQEVFDIISHSELLVSPSLYEGFGIPPLEAMYLSTNVIVSDIPVYREVYHDFPVTFFKAGDVKDLYRKIKNFTYKQMDVRDTINNTYNYQITAHTILSKIVERQC